MDRLALCLHISPVHLNAETCLGLVGEGREVVDSHPRYCPAEKWNRRGRNKLQKTVSTLNLTSRGLHTPGEMLSPGDKTAFYKFKILEMLG
jgi:hypothetical protein